jgi:hypothetical protein
MRDQKSKEPQQPRHLQSNSFNGTTYALDHQSLNLVFDGPDLSHEITGLVGGDAGRNHRTRDTGCTAQSELAGDENIRDILVLAEKGDVQKDSQGVRVRSEDDDFRGTTIEGFSC